MSEQYVRSGRGGAGNFAPKKADAPKEVEMKAKSDLEAQRTTDPSDANSAANVPPPTQSSQFKTYARGGAGNWYEPEALKQSGTFNTAPADPTGEGKYDPSKRSSRVWQGRGGAGNWEADQHYKEEERRKSMNLGSEEGGRVSDEIKAQARREADEEIKPPQEAHVHVPHLDRHQNLGDEVHDI